MAKPFRRPRPKLSPLFFQNKTLAASSGSADVSRVQVSIAALKTRLVALESIKALEFEE